jgi:CPA2 family monovalent cation:H+ antiporter-2
LHSVLLNLAIYLAAAVIAVPLSQRLGLGSVLGYLLAGMAISPALGLAGHELEQVQEIAEYGVVLMLFLIGLEMRPRMLWELRHRLVGLGGLQVGLTLALIAVIARLIGLPWNEAIAVGIILCLSSTAIVLQTLSEKKLVNTEGGRACFAVLLFQDVAAIPLLAILPLLTLGAAGTPPEEAIPAAEAVREASPWMRAAMVLAAGAVVVLAGRFLTRPVYRFLAWAKLPEIQVAGALFLIVAISLLMSLLGLSPALGSFLAGVVLATSEYRHQLEADLAPFKGILLGLFFITVGESVDLARFLDEPARFVLLALILFAVKMLVLWPLSLLFRLPARARLLFTLGLAQAGEFGFFLLGFARATDVLGPEDASTLLLVIAMSMMLTPALFWMHGLISRRMGGAARREADAIDAQGTVIIAGMGRFGQVVNRLVAGTGHATVVIDNHARTVERMRDLGIRVYYGDVTRTELLEAAGVKDAKAVVLATDDPEETLKIARYLRRKHPHVPVIARAHDRHEVYRLQAAGAADSVREVFYSAVRAGRQALVALGHDADEVDRLADEFVTRDRRMLAELAALWREDVPAEANAAYLAMQREQRAAIEAELRRADAPRPPIGGAPKE